MRRWADHDSSDDDEDHHGRNSRGANRPPKEEKEEEDLNTRGEGEEHENQQDSSQDPSSFQKQDDDHQQQKQQPSLRKESYDLPTEAPFTAFVGNLAFSVKEPDQLAQSIIDLVHDRLQQEINVVNARVMIDKHDGKHRGFGYVEVETLDQVSLSQNVNLLVCWNLEKRPS